MTPHKQIREQGAKAFRDGIKLEDNPMVWISNKQQGRHKQAAWDAGWIEEQQNETGI